MTFYRFFNLAGDNSKEATPDPIPNSEVKLFCVDGTARVTVWESRTSPAFFYGAQLKVFTDLTPEPGCSMTSGLKYIPNQGQIENVGRNPS